LEPTKDLTSWKKKKKLEKVTTTPGVSKQAKKDKSGFVCTYCNKNFHTVEYCKKKKKDDAAKASATIVQEEMIVEDFDVCQEKFELWMNNKKHFNSHD
jgi:hypothetical protein